MFWEIEPSSPMFKKRLIFWNISKKISYFLGVSKKKL